jgi:hypothetical protein
MLFPVTDYASERVMYIYRSQDSGYTDYYNVLPGRIKFIPDDRVYHTYSKTTTGDVQGFFKFENLADGEYFVFADVLWEVGNSIQGGALMQKVKVSGGQAIEIVMSQ